MVFNLSNFSHEVKRKLEFISMFIKVINIGHCLHILKLFAGALRNSLHFITTKRLVSYIFFRCVKSHWLFVRRRSRLLIIIVRIFTLITLIEVWLLLRLLIISSVRTLLILVWFLLVISWSLIRLLFLLRKLSWLVRVLSIICIMTVSTFVSKRAWLTVFHISARHFTFLKHY